MYKKLSILLTLVLVFMLSASAQKKFSVYGVGFYNQENLFDTCHDAGKNDYDDGKRQPAHGFDPQSVGTGQARRNPPHEWLVVLTSYACMWR